MAAAHRRHDISEQVVGTPPRQRDRCPDFEWLMTDAIYIKVHPHGGWGLRRQPRHGPH